MEDSQYRGRIAPSPTGYLHLGHARTFWTAFERARENRGVLIFRNEDLDSSRCRTEFAEAMVEDLRWYGIEWQEGPDVGGAFGPYAQSERRNFYVEAWRRLLEGGWIYPCSCSRRELAEAASAPHDDNDEPIYPGTCRGKRLAGDWAVEDSGIPHSPKDGEYGPPGCEYGPPGCEYGAHGCGNGAPVPAGVNWRFRVPDGEAVEFVDGRMGEQRFEAGRDFGDFVVWRRDDVPAYQLAVVVDDAAMQVSEVVRGEDLLRSTARQILLQRALGLATPGYYHCALMTDEHGVRLAKRHDALSLRALRGQGRLPQEVRKMAGADFVLNPKEK